MIVGLRMLFEKYFNAARYAFCRSMVIVNIECVALAYALRSLSSPLSISPLLFHSRNCCSTASVCAAVGS